MKTYPPSSVGRLALVLGILSAFGPLSIDMYLPGLPAIGAEFGTDTAAAQLTLTVFFLGLAFGQIVYGPLSDRFGRRKPLLVGAIIYTLASVGCALAPTLGSLVWLRLLQALGGCAGVVIARSIVRDRFDAQDSARMYSLLMLVMGLAPITAPVLGGQLIVHFGWRAVFWVLTVFGMICVALVLFALHESLPRERRNQDGFAAVLRVYGLLLRDRHFLSYALTGGFISAGMFAYISGSPFVFIELFGVSPQLYGWIFGANAAGLIAASQFNRRLLRSFTSTTILSVALAVIATSGVMLVAVAATGFGGLLGLLPFLFVCIAGYGLVAPNAAAEAMAPHGRVAGSAAALLGMLQFSIGALAGTLVGVLHNGTAVPMAAVMATCCLAGLGVFHLRPLGGPVPHPQPEA
ncbi:Bcr/CflA family multidrug efflux MFS transporter [Candidatus Chloroploca sp. Khr17]|uniref:Bcr/CflA family multidrug efflux MFS transporter n=1 Tax=Candidatus Chloroploca sp. Khr17 TaxID=2496869 RepID=UPI00101C8DB3|nr:Bcr/CflA family multidrug efflux MFS transporter [Candidatus Chloroploca sp. Khr17]